ncbi:helix-turn-helix domain-containing protein [uncultured Vagococcus sp.]|uniref:helix-turn-helix domain-containing protein n=1 Tax=uncultured Vagococcus sp. TaxID=189676 RepID=UPI0028D362D6|nr:helix-turn-helix domain-containing protein [uncultured Vagococcus sp.]
MEDLLDVTEQRALLFLRALYKEERWWTEKELSIIGKCSANTTYRTLDILNELYFQQTNDLIILSKKYKGFYLKTSHSLYSIGKIESLFLKDTLCYKLIDHLFQCKDVSIKSLTDTFYLSSSTIYRKLQLIKLFLEKSGLTIDIGNFHLSGPEHLIREFFYRFYWHVIKSEKWPFHLVSYDELLIDYYQIIDENEFSITEIERLQFFYRLAINCTRHQHQQFLIEGPNMELLDDHFKRYSTYMKPFVTHLVPEAYFENEWSFLALIFVSNPIFLDHLNGYHLKIDWHQLHQTSSSLFATHFIQLFKQFNPEVMIQNEQGCLYKLLCIYLYVVIFSDIKIHHSNIQEFLDEVAEGNPLFFNQIKQIVGILAPIIDEDVPHFDQDYLLYNCLLIFSSAIDLTRLKKEIKIKLVCATEPLSEEYIRQQLLQLPDFNLKIDTSSQIPTEASEYDLLLSDIYIKKFALATKTFVLDFPPSERDWRKLMTVIGTIDTTN